MCDSVKVAHAFILLCNCYFLLAYKKLANLSEWECMVHHGVADTSSHIVEIKAWDRERSDRTRAHAATGHHTFVQWRWRDLAVVRVTLVTISPSIGIYTLHATYSPSPYDASPQPPLVLLMSTSTPWLHSSPSPYDDVAWTPAEDRALEFSKRGQPRWAGTGRGRSP